MRELVGISDFTLTLPDKRILSIPRLTVVQNQVVTLFGPIGCGKSTLLSIIAGLIFPGHTRYSGVILLQGHPLSEYAAHRSPATIVWQDQRLFDHLSVLDNVAFPLRMAGQSRRNAIEIAGAILDSLGLPTLRRESITFNLSGGERQVVAIARGIARIKSGTSCVLLLDEPFRNLSMARAMAAEHVIIEALRCADGCALMVSHSVESLTMKAHSIAVARPVSAGHMVEQFGGVDELCNNDKYFALCEELGLLARVDDRTIIPTDHLRVEVPCSHARSVPGTIEQVQFSPFGTLLRVRVFETRVWTVRAGGNHNLTVGDSVSVVWDDDADSV